MTTNHRQPDYCNCDHADSMHTAEGCMRMGCDCEPRPTGTARERDALERAARAEAALADAAMACGYWGAGPVADRIMRMKVSFGDRMEAKNSQIARLEAVAGAAKDVYGIVRHRVLDYVRHESDCRTYVTAWQEKREPCSCGLQDILNEMATRMDNLDAALAALEAKE